MIKGRVCNLRQSLAALQALLDSCSMRLVQKQERVCAKVSNPSLLSSLLQMLLSRIDDNALQTADTIVSGCSVFCCDVVQQQQTLHAGQK